MAELQVNLKVEQEVVEEKKAQTTALIENIGQEKAVVDEAVESSRADEEQAAALQVTLPAIIDSILSLPLCIACNFGIRFSR